MPRVAVPITVLTRAGVDPPAESNGDPVNNHSVVNDGKVSLEARNAHATLPRNITFRFPDLVDGQSVSPRVVALPANMAAARRFGPFPPNLYGQLMQVDVETVDVKLRAFQNG